MSKDKKLPEIEIHVFMDNGSVSLVKHKFGKLIMPHETGVIILRASEFVKKTEYKRRYPECKEDLKYLDPHRNVVREKKVDYGSKGLVQKTKKDSGRSD